MKFIVGLVDAFLNCILGPSILVTSAIRKNSPLGLGSDWEIALDENGVSNHVTITRESFECSCRHNRHYGSVCKHMMFIVSRVLRSPFVAEQVQITRADTPLQLYIKNLDKKLACVFGSENTIIKVNKGETSDECPICLDPFENGRAFVCVHGCRVRYHLRCIQRYMVSKPPYHLFHCPTCRYIYTRQDINNQRPDYLKRFTGLLEA